MWAVLFLPLKCGLMDCGGSLGSGLAVARDSHASRGSGGSVCMAALGF